MKKWTYLVAILAMVFATPVFTGCIDNEEPAGIEELRTAKAELLRAKAAVLNAQVDALKLKAEAEAAIAAAQAAYEQALADYAAAKADSMSATAEKAKIEAQKAAADLEVYLMKKKAELAGWEAIYEAAMKNLALAKVQLTEAQKGYLAGWIKAAEDAYKTWQEAIGAVETATQDLANLMKMMEKQEASGLLFREAERNLAKTKAAWEAAEEAAELAAELAADTLDVDKFATTLAELEADSIAAKKELADLQVERVKLVAETAEEWETIKDSIKYYADLTGYNWKEGEQSITRNGEVEKVYDDYGFELDDEGNRKIENEAEVTPFEFDNTIIVLDGKGLPYGVGMVLAPAADEDESPETWEFEYPDYVQAVAGGKTYTPDEKKYWQKTARDIKKLVRNANDEAWNAEYQKMLADTIANLQAEDSELAMAKDSLEALVAAYVKGDVFANPSDMEGFDAVEDSVEAFNTALAAAVKAWDEMNVLADSLAEINDTIQEKIAALEEKLDADTTAVYEENHNLWIERADGAYALMLDKNAKDAAVKTLEADSLVLELLGDTVALKALVADLAEAREAAADADTLLTEYNVKTDTLIDEAEALAVAQIAALKAAYAEDLAAIFAESHTNNPYWATLHERFHTKWNALEAASFDVLQKAKEVIGARSTFFEANKLDELCLEDYTTLLEAFKTGEPVNAEDVVILDKEKVEEAIKTLSEKVYGINGTNEYGENTARLLALTVDELVQIATDHVTNCIEAAAEKAAGLCPDANIALAKKVMEANMTVIVAHKLDSDFGLMGDLAAKQVKLEIVKAYTDNAAIIEDILAQIQDAIDTIDAQIKEALAEVEAAEASFTKLYDAYAAKFEDIDAEIETAEAAIKAIMPVIDEIKNAIETYMTYIDGITAGDEEFTAAVDSMELAQQFNLKSSAPGNGNTVMIEDLEDLHNLLDYYAAQAEEDAFAAETAYLKEAALLDMLKEGRMAWMEYAEKKVEDAIAAEAEAAEAYNEAMEALAAQLEAIGESTSAEDAIMQGGNSAPQP